MMFGGGPIGSMAFGDAPDSFEIRAGSQLPVLLTQAILIAGEKTTEGRLIEAVAPAWIEILRLIDKDPSAIYNIPPRVGGNHRGRLRAKWLRSSNVDAAKR